MYKTDYSITLLTTFLQLPLYQILSISSNCNSVLPLNHKFELYELRQLITFAETGTLSETAEILHLSQPALSRNMKKLEEDLGLTLFERTKNKLSLNKNGEVKH